MLSAVSPPWVDSTLRTTGTNLPTNSIVLTLTSVTAIPQGTAPLSLAFAQAGVGCDVLVAPDILGLAVTTTGTVESNLFLLQRRYPSTSRAQNRGSTRSNASDNASIEAQRTAPPDTAPSPPAAAAPRSPTPSPRPLGGPDGIATAGHAANTVPAAAARHALSPRRAEPRSGAAIRPASPNYAARTSLFH